jgi:hypothetical protein
MKKVLHIIVMVSLLILYAGIVQAEGPGNNVMFPLICTVSNNGGLGQPLLNTTVYVAETNGIARNGQVFVYNETSVVFEFAVHWTPFDVVSSDCETIINMMPLATQEAMKTIIDGTTYYVGFIVYTDISDTDDCLTGWAYLADFRRSFASGLNGITLQGQDIPFRLLPRYYLGARSPDTFNWWIIFTGSIPGRGSNNPCRFLNGIICDEAENCLNISIPIPNMLNIISVADILPAPLNHSPFFTSSGFASLNVHYIVHEGGGCDSSNDTIFGWSYERVGASVIPFPHPIITKNWDVIHPILRDTSIPPQ